MAETYDDACSVDVTVLLPAYNEEDAVRGAIDETRRALEGWHGTWEILLVDDASTDGTRERAEKECVRVVSRTENGGAGAACKTGLLAARGRVVALLDADGSYDPSHLPELLAFLPDYDQVNGTRTSEAGKYKLLRTPTKWLIRKLAEWVVGYRIPDLNTGMKVFKRDVMLQYLWVIPDGFSNVTSMTLAFLANGHAVKFIPVSYRTRIGESKFHPIRDTGHYVLTVIRIVMYFRPLRVFLPLAVIVALLAMLSGVHNILTSPMGLHDTDVILLVTALSILVVGLLADLIVAQRRGLGLSHGLTGQDLTGMNQSNSP